MSRGNKRDKDRENALKAQAKRASANTMSGPEQARAREEAAAIMRKKQAAADAKKAGKGARNK